MEEKDIDHRSKYACAFCGAEYDSAPARARCELECDEKRKQEVERIKREYLRAEKNIRQDEVHKAYQGFIDAASKYRSDYSENAPLSAEMNGVPLYKLFWW